MVESACAEAQTEELLALQSIFCEDCVVESEAPGQVAFGLRVDVDLGLGEGGVRLGAEVEEEEDGGEPSGEAAAATAGGGVAEGATYSELANTSVLELARQKIFGQPQVASAPALARSPSGRHLHTAAPVKHLPPLTLQVSLPPDYPEVTEPQFHLECSWLDAKHLEQLCAELDARAAEMQGLPVVFTWAELLRSETASLLGLSGSVTLSSSHEATDMRAVAECTDPVASLLELVQYDQRKEQELWRQQLHCCQICFSERPGSQFVHLGGCAHAFCSECVSEMARLHVAEGSILELRCPQPDCRAEMAVGTLEQVLEEEAYERWLRLKIQQVMSSTLENVVFCPACEENGIESPTIAEKPASEEEAPVAECRHCSFLFCGKCLGVAHARVADCISEEERLMQVSLRKLEGKPLSAADKRRQQKAMQRMTKGMALEIEAHGSVPRVHPAGYVEEAFGTMHEGDEILSVCTGTLADAENQTEIWSKEKDGLGGLEAAINSRGPLVVRFIAPRASDAQQRLMKKRAVEELMTLRALKKDSQSCPKCKVRINRSAGCNHMQCTSCGTHFCYRCGAWMNPVDPYSHFKTSSCTTFDREEVQRVNDEQRRGVDQELAELRRQFGRQEELFAQFAAQQAGVRPRRRPQDRGDGSACPTCRQRNPRSGRLNHVRCQYCRTSYCHQCKKRIEGVVTNHFRGEGACPQHGDAE